MTSYETIDSLPDLSSSEITSATRQTFSAYSLDGGGASGWDNRVYYTAENDSAVIIFSGKEGATYDIFSLSFYKDPLSLVLYDKNGNAVASDKDQGTIGGDMIFNFIAPYSGDYYIKSSWLKDSSTSLSDSISVYEDVDTIGIEHDPTPLPLPDSIISEPLNDTDRIFNWGESVYPDLLTEHQSSIDIFGYYARTYSNGDAVGEKDGNVYYYDGGADGSGEIVLVGTAADLLQQASLAGF